MLLCIYKYMLLTKLCSLHTVLYEARSFGHFNSHPPDWTFGRCGLCISYFFSRESGIKLIPRRLYPPEVREVRSQSELSLRCDIVEYHNRGF